MKYLVLLSLLCIGAKFSGDTLIGQGLMGVPLSGNTPIAAPGLTATFDDNHNSDHSDWVGYGTLTCTENAAASGNLSPGASRGSCNFTGGDQGAQPTSADQWGVMQYPTNVDDSGVALRTKDGDMGSTEYFYAARWEPTNVIIRVCDGDLNDSDCATLGGVGGGFAHGEGATIANDQLFFAVAGTGDDTVLCAWVVPATFINTMCDPDNWVGILDATYCINDDGTPVGEGGGVLDSYIDCGVNTECDSWGTDGPDDLKGFQDGGTFKNVRAYAGNTTEANFSTRTCGGAL